MTSEVKERIDQIRHGIVPEGYIKSKDGIYPGDWTSKKMGQWLQLMERPISLEDDEKYELVTVRRGFGGVDSRGTYLGKNVLVKNYFCLCTGDFVISKRQIAHGACGVVPAELDGAVVSNEYNVFIPQEGTNINMFNLMMQLPHYRRLFYLMSDGVHIEKLLFKTDDWMRRSLAMPSLEEQERIASILTMQDKIIELEQQEIGEIKKAKRFFLEKMFPKEGQAVPEIRFKGFTAPWEKRKFSDITFPAGKKNKDNLPLESYSITNEYGFVPQDEKFENGGTMREADKRMYYIVSPNSFAYNPARINVGSIGYQNVGKNVIVSSLYEVFKTSEDVDDRLLWHWFKSPDFQKLIMQLQEGGVRLYFYYDKLCMGEVFLPSLEEQRKIGKLFDTIDHLITLHQRKLEEEKRKKKALMQLLLTGLVRVNA